MTGHQAHKMETSVVICSCQQQVSQVSHDVATRGDRFGFERTSEAFILILPLYTFYPES